MDLRGYRHLDTGLWIAPDPNTFICHCEDAKAQEFHCLACGESVADPLGHLFNHTR